MEETAASPFEASEAHATVAASPLYPAPHLTLQSVLTVRVIPPVHAFESPPTTPGGKEKAAHAVISTHRVDVVISKANERGKMPCLHPLPVMMQWSCLDQGLDR